MSQAYKVGIKQFDCCNDQRIICNESFSYECSIDPDTNKLFIDTNDYCTNGFTNFECMNCNKQFGNFNEITMEY